MSNENPNYGFLKDKIKEQRLILLQGGTRCLAGDTLVNTINGYLPIKDIAVNDFVYSEKNGKVVLRRVLNKFIYTNEHSCINTVTFVLNNNIKIQSTYEHKHLQCNGYVKAIDIAKRAMERGYKYTGEIHDKQFWEISGHELQELETCQNNETRKRCKWIHEDYDFNQWQIFNSKNSQNSCSNMDSKQRQQTSSKSYKSQQGRQPSRKFRVGDSYREYSTYDEARQANNEQRFEKWDVKNDRGTNKRGKGIISTLCSYGKRLSQKIWNKNIDNERYFKAQNLEANIINIENIQEIIFNENIDFVYDIEVEETHNYLITLNNYVTHNSGKTRSCIDFIIMYCMNFQSIEIDICRDTFTSLRSTVYKEFQEVLRAYKINFDINKSENIIKLNGNTITFYGLDNDEKIHGRERDIIWINEINQIKEEVYDQIAPRTRHRILGDFNPRLGRKHWLDQYIRKYPPLITTYKDNPFLTDAQVQDIESKRDNKYWWSIYGKGERAIIEGAIFTNWEVGSFDESLQYIYGQDFGFNPDPTTLVKVAVCNKRKHIYLKECYFNGNQLTTEEIYQLNKAHISRNNDLIIADSAEPRLIFEVAAKGLNVQKAVKGPNSVLYGLSKMLEYKIIVTPESDNLIDELSNYVWNDKKAGLPIDKYNHGIDAMRYAFIRLTSVNNNIKQVGLPHLI